MTKSQQNNDATLHVLHFSLLNRKSFEASVNYTIASLFCLMNGIWLLLSNWINKAGQKAFERHGQVDSRQVEVDQAHWNVHSNLYSFLFSSLSSALFYESPKDSYRPFAWRRAWEFTNTKKCQTASLTLRHPELYKNESNVPLLLFFFTLFSFAQNEDNQRERQKNWKFSSIVYFLLILFSSAGWR